ncbi:hypothetical protein OF83DRAFT_1060823 [Amylostereum chailletii]|nr:hypothetical protein OF83DRAFT_1060823 [Amylostereum chailletii]
MESNTTNPPTRVVVSSSKDLSLKDAQTSVADFLVDFEGRASTLKGGDHSVTVQLQKLSAALEEERKRSRKVDKGAGL